MSTSSYVWQPDYERLSATGHNKKGKPLRQQKPARALVAGSLHTTAPEYARFVMTMMGSAGKRTLRIAQETRTAMLTPQNKFTDRIYWGLGWGLQPGPAGWAFWHWGNSDGFTSFVIAYPEAEIGVVIMTNGVGGLRVCKEVVPEAIGGGYPAYFSN